MALPLDVEAVGGDHPEKKTGEILLTNGVQGFFDKLPYATKRIGKVAYDLNGDKLKGDLLKDCFPIFVGEAEYEQFKLAK